MTEKFNDEQSAIDDIINAPEVTATTPEPEKKQNKKEKKKKEATPSKEIINIEEKANKNGKLLSQSINEAVKNTSGTELSAEKIDAITELATSIFRMGALPRGLNTIFLISALVIPLAPSILKTRKAFKQEKEKKDDNSDIDIISN